MKEEASQIIGKRITAVVIKAAEDRRSSPVSQVILVFDDGTHYEFYSPDGRIIPTGGVDKGGLESALKYKGHSEVIYCATEDPDGSDVSRQIYGSYLDHRHE